MPHTRKPDLIRVLLADDDATIRKLVACSLPQKGFAVEVISDGALARDHLKAWEVDVLVTDIGMPGMGGMELIRWTRAHRPEVRIVAITGLNTPELITACLELGATRCLAKPFTMEVLARAINLAASVMPA